MLNKAGKCTSFRITKTVDCTTGNLNLTYSRTRVPHRQCKELAYILPLHYPAKCTKLEENIN